MTHVALVGDMNTQAYDRLLDEYNFAGYPSVFYDGGDTVGVGGSSNQDYYRGRIEAAGARAVPNLDLIIKMKHINNAIYEVTVKVGNGVDANTAPTIPQITGPTESEANIINNFVVTSNDQDADQLLYQFEFDGQTDPQWYGPFASGANCSLDHTWTQNGTYSIRARTKDSWDIITDWSPLHSVQVGCCISERGNIEGDINDSIDISDLVFLVDFIFTGGPAPSCPEEANVDGDVGNNIDISDLVALVDFIFTNGPTPGACP